MSSTFENVGWLQDGSQNHQNIFDASAPMDPLRLQLLQFVFAYVLTLTFTSSDML